MGLAYESLGYKRLIVDYHFSAFVPGTLINADPEAYVDTCVNLGVDSVLVYAKDHWGHCYYATESFPRHPNVPGDLFGDVLTGLQARKITGYAYFSVGWDEHAVRKHPDWAMRRADDTPIRRGAPPDDRITGRWTYLCLNSPYRDYALSQIREIVTRYDLPALFLDIVFLIPTNPICACPHCQTLWAQNHDGTIPTAYTPDYLDFAISGFRRFFHDVKAIIAESGKSVQITHNFGPPYDTDDYLAFEMNPLGRNYLRGSALAKIMRAEAAGREVEMIGHRFNQDWDFVTKPPGLMRWEAATILAHNCALMWVDQPNMDGTFDPAASAAMKSAYAVVDDLAPHLRGSQPVAEIALLYPTRSIMLDPGEELDFVGAYKLLTEQHWAFDVVVASHLSAESLSYYRLLIVPHAHDLEITTITAITRYLENGGSLFFTGHTAEGLGLVTLEGLLPHPASFILPESNFNLHSTHLRITESHTFQPQADAQVRAVYVAPNIEVTSEQWVSHNVAPGLVTDLPAVVSGTGGNGRYSYAAPRFFAEYMRQGVPAVAEFLAALLVELAAPRLQIDAPVIVEVTYNRQGNDLVICLVNGVIGRPVLGGILMLRESPGFLVYDETIPIHNITIHLPQDHHTVAYDGSGNALPTTISEGHTLITLPSLEEYAVVRIPEYFEP